MKVIRNFIYNMSYQILVLIAPLITVPYISRVLGAEGVGVNTFTNSIIQYFVLFGSIGITFYGSREIAYVQTDMVARSKKFWEIEILKIVTASVSYLFFFIFLYFYHHFQTYMLYQSVLVVAAGIDISWFYTGLENFKRTVIRNALVKVAGIILIFSLVKRQSDVGIYILLLSVTQLLGNASLWPYLRKDIIWPGWSKLNIFKNFKPAMLLFIPQIAIQIYVVLNRTMLGQMVSVKSAAYFQYSDQFIKMALAITTATGPVLLPRVSHAFALRQTSKVYDYLRTGFEFVSMLAFPMVFGIVAIAKKFAPWFMGEQFQPVGSLMILESPIIIFIAWSGVIGQQFLIPTKRVKQYTTSVTIGVVVNVVLNVVLIYMYQASGAVLATVAAELAVTLYQLACIRNEINIGRLLRRCWPYLFASVVMYIPVRLIIGTLKISIFSLILSIAVGIIVYFSLLIIMRVPMYKLGLEVVRTHMKNKNEEKYNSDL